MNSFTPKSPRELKEERIKKEQNMKKMMLLQEFEVPEDHKKDFVVHSPTTEAMKNSINTIKIDLKVDFKLYNEKFKNTNNLLIEDKKANLIKGKKPCARDGCSASIYNDKIIFFGGDRHQMTFHDMYFFNLKNISNEVQEAKD